MSTATEISRLSTARDTIRDKLIDLGCGDGRILFKAVQMRNCTGVGIDINKKLIDECIEKAKKENLDDKLRFYVDDFSKDNFNFIDIFYNHKWKKIGFLISTNQMHQRSN